MSGKARFDAFVDELQKLSAGNPPKPKRPKQRKPDHPMMTVGKTMAGTGVGIAAGYGIAKALESVARKKGFPIQQLIPLSVAGAGTLGGISYPLLRAYEKKKLDEYASRRS